MKLTQLLLPLGLSTVCFANYADNALNRCSQSTKGGKAAACLHGPVLKATTTNLALSVNCPTLAANCAAANPALTGHTRQIAITNVGDQPASNLTVQYPALPQGTSASSNCNGVSLAPNSSCTITVTPGTVATFGINNAACTSGTAPSPGVITVKSSDSAATAFSNVVVLGYGCQYQQGFVYAIDDSQGCSGNNCVGSVGGTITAVNDQTAKFPNGLVWASNGTSKSDENSFGNPCNSGSIDHICLNSSDPIPGIADNSTPANMQPSYADFASFFAKNYTNSNPFNANSFQACSGLYDGNCNTSNIFTFYNTLTTHNGPQYAFRYTALNAPTPLSYYPVGVCKGYTVDASGNSPCTSGSCYSNWYLPAVCQLNAQGCVAGTQSIVTNLSGLVGNTGGNFETSCSFGSHCMTSNYWSSTEVGGNNISYPITNAWVTNFNGSNSSNNGNAKPVQFGVRCSRALTQ